jgi:SAM-dependent methyltransferase
MGSFDENSPQLALTPTQELFREAWQVYRKMVDNDYLSHKGAYGCLHRILIDEIGRPFRFLDIACGDASMSVEALRNTAVIRYDGIDISWQALEIASANLSCLQCPTLLHEGDFAEVLANWRDKADVAWIGLSLHHFQTPEKLAVMLNIRRILEENGQLLIYEDASPDGENREAWMSRWDAQKPLWTAYDDTEWNFVTAHVHSSDFPETDAVWRELGREAGFRHVDEHFVSPSGLFRLYGFKV